jgi:hypothetical protein
MLSHAALITGLWMTRPPSDPVTDNLCTPQQRILDRRPRVPLRGLRRHRHGAADLHSTAALGGRP